MLNVIVVMLSSCIPLGQSCTFGFALKFYRYDIVYELAAYPRDGENYSGKILVKVNVVDKRYIPVPRAIFIRTPFCCSYGS